MLQPEYFNDKADRMLEIYRQLENFIFQDIAGRLLEARAMSGTADRMIWKLKQMGESKTAIINKLAVLTGLSRRELKELLQEAVLTSWEDGLSTFNQMGIPVVNPLENPAVMSIMNAEYKKSLGELKNLTRTTMDQASQDLVRMLDEAEIRVASGVQSYSQAVCDILDNYARKGIQIGYPTGAKRSLEAAVRMCVVTSMNQTSAQITNQYIIEGGVEYVLVSAHLGARTQQEGQPYLAGHENWQGKVYKIRGSEPGIPNLAEMTGYDIDENGKGKVINPLGLHGYNCRHSHKAWDKDLKNPYVDEKGNSIIDQEESRKLYEKQQKQRAMERSIRKTKRELLMKQKEIDMVAETDVKDILQKDYDQLADTLRKQNKSYHEFCEENDLQTQQDRLKVAGFKRAQAAKARGRARAYEHQEKEKTIQTTEFEENKLQYLRNNLPKGYEDQRSIGNRISENDLKSFEAKAEEYGIRVTGFENYYGDVKILDEILERLNSNNQHFIIGNPKSKDIILNYDNVLGYDGDNSKIDIGAFAMTKGKTITLNKFMYDDSSFMKREYIDAVDKGILAKGTTYLNVIDHEYAHIVNGHNPKLYYKVLAEVEKRAYNKNIKADDYIIENISLYAAYRNEYGIFSEIISELCSMSVGAKNEFAIELLRKAGVLYEN